MNITKLNSNEISCVAGGKKRKGGAKPTAIVESPPELPWGVQMMFVIAFGVIIVSTFATLFIFNARPKIDKIVYERNFRLGNSNSCMESFPVGGSSLWRLIKYLFSMVF